MFQIQKFSEEHSRLCGVIDSLRKDGGSSSSGSEKKKKKVTGGQQAKTSPRPTRAATRGGNAPKQPPARAAAKSASPRVSAKGASARTTAKTSQPRPKSPPGRPSSQRYGKPMPRGGKKL